MIERQRGFSLLEILVAFAIMAVALTIVLRIFGSGVNAAVNAEDYTIAVQIAESLMARTGVEQPLQTGELTGREAGRYHWSVAVSPVQTPPPARRLRFKSQEPEQEPNPLRLMAVRVRVSWGNDERNPHLLELNSLKLSKDTEL